MCARRGTQPSTYIFAFFRAYLVYVLDVDTTISREPWREQEILARCRVLYVLRRLRRDLRLFRQQWAACMDRRGGGASGCPGYFLCAEVA